MTRLTSMILIGMALCVADATALVFQARNASLKDSPDGHLYINGEVAEYVRIYQSGTYQVAALALGTPMDGVWPVMGLSIDGLPRDTVTVGTMTMVQYNFSVALDPGVYTIGMAFLNDAISAYEDRNIYLDAIGVFAPGGATDPIITTRSAWLTSVQARENALLAATTAAIVEHRMGAATVTVLDAAGKPVQGASVTVEQIGHEFLFGANICGYEQFSNPSLNEVYKQRFAELFNYATVPFYWSLIEPVYGQRQYAWIDAMVNWCVANGIEAKGHALLWTDPAAIPPWSGGMPNATLQQAHVTDIMQRYAGLIKNWEVVNEPVNAPGLTLNPAHQWARAIDPAGRLIVNEYGHFYNGLPEYYNLIQQANTDGVSFDAMGFQAHAPVDRAFPLEHVRYILDQYAALGKKVHITEFTPASNGQPVTGAVWRGVWDESTQAAYAEAFYRICFAHPAVEAISWWDFSDTGAWVPGGGMLRSDCSPKPVYNALKQLIHDEWKTEQTGQTQSGQYQFTGYHGRYRVIVQHNDTTREVQFHVRQGGNNTVTVTLPASTPVEIKVTVNPLSTNQTYPTITGTVENASVVDVSVDGVNYHRATVSGSTWSAQIVQALDDGVYEVRAVARVSDKGKDTADATNQLVLDRTAPVIVLNGSSVVTVRRFSRYVDAGATAWDNICGDVSARIVTKNNVSTLRSGTYYVFYSVKDDVGNASQAVRTVYVR